MKCLTPARPCLGNQVSVMLFEESTPEQELPLCRCLEGRAGLSRDSMLSHNQPIGHGHRDTSTEIAVFLSLMKSGFFQPGNWENTLGYLYPRAVSR